MIVPLPQGLWESGALHREAEIRPLTGEDEATLIARASDSPVRRATLLLGRCIVRVGQIAAAGPDLAPRLTVGDRDALLLHLRRLNLGEGFSCSVRCPAAACRRPMEVALRVADLLAAPGPDRPAWHEATLPFQDGPRAARFRLPTAQDQEAAAQAAAAGLDAAALLLARRCVADDAPADAWSAQTVAALASRMAALDEQAEILLDLACPACGHRFQTLFDPMSHVLAEVAGQDGQLDREIHTLALHYHWGHAEILSLPRERRRTFLLLLEQTLGAGEEAA